MNRPIFNELYYKVFQSGNPLFLFIGVNTLIFLAINLLAVGGFLFSGQTYASDWLTLQLSLPAHWEKIPLKFWTLLTYMFTQKAFFHFLFNMLWLYWLGIIFLEFLNKRQFIFTYFAGGLSGAIVYVLAYNFIPVFQDAAESSVLLGSSASVMAVVVATATMVPDYSIHLLFFGGVRLKYLALVYFILDILGVAGGNPGGSMAHMGGAILGFIFIKQLKNGSDWSTIFKKKKKLKIVREEKRSYPSRPSAITDQEIVDRILDKISRSGYESLTKLEKEQLFNASKKDEQR